MRFTPFIGAAAAVVLAACGGGGGGFGSQQNVTMTTEVLPSGTTGVAYQASLAAEFPHPPGVFAIVTGALPTGLKLDSGSGEITGYPRQVGNFIVTIVARDGSDPDIPLDRDATFAEDAATFHIAIDRGLPNILPQVVPPAQYRNSYSYQIDVAGGTAPYTFALTGGALPAGMSISPSGNLGTFPTAAQPLPYEFDVTVTDANGLQDTQHMQVSVVVLPLVILTSKVPQGALNFPYDYLLQLGSIGGGAPITWSQEPPTGAEVSLASFGMYVTPDGHLKSDAGPTSLGSHLFTIKVTDEAGQDDYRQYDLVVNPGPVLYSITPNRATGAPPFVVAGANFQPGAQLIFKPGPTQTTTPTNFVNANTLTFPSVPPAPGSGGVAVMVLNPDGGYFTLPNAFVFPANTIAYDSKGFIGSALSSTGLACADLTGDGFADIVHSGAAGISPYQPGAGAPTSTSSGLIYYKNNGNLTFTATTLDSGAFTDVKIVDVNNDSRPDIVALGTSSIKVWLNGVGVNPLGVLTAGPTSSLGGGSTWNSGMTVGKIDGDGYIDLAYGTPYYPAATPYGSVYSMKGNGTGSFTPLASQTTQMTPYCYGVNKLVCVDTDGNGRDEIAAGQGMGYSVGPMIKYSVTQPDGSFGGWSGYGTGSNYYGTTYGIGAGDFLGDGTRQVIAVQGSPPPYGSTKMMTLHSGANLSTTTTINNLPSGLMKDVCALDADFDPKDDWAVSYANTGVAVYKGATQNLVANLDASVGSPNVSSPKTGRIASGDLNGDGRPDLLVTSSFWACETMAAWQNYSYYAAGITGDGGSKGIVFWLNSSN